MERFFCPHLDGGLLDESESHHCLQVFRNKVGDLIVAFDGQGREWKVRIESVTGKRVNFSKLTETRSPKSSWKISLVQAIPKGKSMEVILQKATELGAAEIIPIASERTVVKVSEDRAENKVEKWRETIIEAAKQSGQNWLPEVVPAKRLKDFLAEQRPSAGKIIASLQPEAQPIQQTLRELLTQNPGMRELLIMIGPEGDFTPAEVGEARSAGYLPVSLGPLVLRSETAALYVLSILRYETGDKCP